MLGLFQRVKEKELTNAVLAFGGGFYKTLRQSMDTSSIDILTLQTEFPIMAISVANAFVLLRKANSRRLLTSNTKNTSMAYALHFERITKGKISAESHASQLAYRLAQGDGAEYTRIICEESPENQPEQLLELFLKRVAASIPRSKLEQTNEGIASSLSNFINALQKAGL